MAALLQATPPALEYTRFASPALKQGPRDRADDAHSRIATDDCLRYAVVSCALKKLSVVTSIPP